MILLREVTDQEIKEVFQKMNPNKSPGPDGLTSSFFTKHWGNTVCHIIKQFFTSGYHPHFLNNTLRVRLDDGKANKKCRNVCFPAFLMRLVCKNVYP